MSESGNSVGAGTRTAVCRRLRSMRESGYASLITFTEPLSDGVPQEATVASN